MDRAYLIILVGILLKIALAGKELLGEGEFFCGQ